ncbi:hypothetical protein A2627_00890 [Candidatus Woesebacteria bacterium RIFCSPHIGHO2_01_FULL_39_28]|uniref:Uncharacterized protein n=1 Tax=Candidatus Woesebacteria bacterium RIFCSPHIGHO2_01_FULL_39_28 TaxID=1802496 RepID=A0A1F7YGU2_9BACT|nr:MAG: hypothetical protein A2627_00890 [Candidatus Woesebacteria bacterium RIFCSPHIGHO2_01_FULL_39_28]OGM58727.1 MAG: hypothetical protein A3A50_02970 [Candidatus Woesebacteria bacterium RIFCSPLOWO2_01_FULL_38_20]
MKNINYLATLEKFVADKNIDLEAKTEIQSYGKNGLNEISNQSLFPDEIMPDIPNPKMINNIDELSRYKSILSEWLGKFIGEPRRGDEFERGMGLQRKLTFRAMELAAKKVN